MTEKRNIVTIEFTRDYEIMGVVVKKKGERLEVEKIFDFTNGFKWKTINSKMSVGFGEHEAKEIAYSDVSTQSGDMITENDLKTLKEIPCPLKCADNMFSKCVDVYELKKEAMKWILFLKQELKKYNGNTLGVDVIEDLAVEFLRSRLNFIKEFFNITEKDFIVFKKEVYTKSGCKK